LKVIAYYLSNLKQEINSFYKKPYNPILGETHTCSIESEKYGQTIFIAEQVSHHPPISAVYMYNEKQRIAIMNSYSFKVNFYSNSVTVTTHGILDISLGSWGENYLSSQCLPQLLINRVIWGKRIMHWANEVEVNCPQTGVIAKFSFISQNNKEETNSYTGKIYHEGAPSDIIYSYEGDCGYTTVYHSKEVKEQVLIDVPSLKKNKVLYQPYEQLPPTSSMKVWEETNKSICSDDMAKADIAKKIVEDNQRKRIKDGPPVELQYFFFDEAKQRWLPKKKVV